MILYAIYKSGFHKGNERGINGRDAIINYITASELSEFMTDEEFLNQYSFTKAVEGIHYNEKLALL